MRTSFNLYGWDSPIRMLLFAGRPVREKMIALSMHAKPGGQGAVIAQIAQLCVRSAGTCTQALPLAGRPVWQMTKNCVQLSRTIRSSCRLLGHQPGRCPTSAYSQRLLYAGPAVCGASAGQTAYFCVRMCRTVRRACHSRAAHTGAAKVADWDIVLFRHSPCICLAREKVTTV